MKKNIFLFSLFLMLGLAANAANEKSNLNNLNNKISVIQQSITQTQQQRTEYSKELKQIEVTSGKIQSTLQKTQTQLNQQYQQLNDLQKNTQKLVRTLDQQQKQLDQQVRSAYLLSRQPYLKLLLSQEDPAKINRMLVYYHYLSQQQIKNIQNLQITLGQLQVNQQKIQEHTEQLNSLKKQQLDTQVKLSNTKNSRQQLIHQMSQQLQNKQQKLAQLIANKKLLEQTLSRLESGPTISGQNFSSSKGKLPWPTQGKLINQFGESVYGSELKSSSILIKAPEDQPVRAVASGKIVFADWMPGYGMLIIINHGNGYMTLYGRNHNLYKKVGDTVQGGETIASVGNSGGYQEPALYFEIRYNAKPLNPSQWCTNRI